MNWLRGIAQALPHIFGDITTILKYRNLINFVKKREMEHLIPVNYPESLAFSLKLGNQEFKSEMKTLSLIKLYELGKISSGLAAKLLSMSRVDFLDLLEKYNVSYFHKGLENEIETDFLNA